MAYKESNMMPIGTKAPDFILPDTISGKSLSLSDFAGEVATVIMFICNHCPYVIHVNDQLIQLAKDYSQKGIAFIAISSNDVEKYPQDGPEKMQEHALKLGYPFPYLYDESQEVAKKYDAACTPDLYVFDKDLVLTYRGRLDSSRPNSGNPVTGEDLRKALDCILNNMPVDKIQYPSAGCNIKWKAN
jgi:peroxiredoxin